MEKAAFSIYMGVLITAPLLFGAVHPYAYTLLFLAILAATLLLLKGSIKRDVRTGGYQVAILRTGFNAAFAAILLFLVFQSVPLPGAVVRTLSPETWLAGLKSLPLSQTADSTPSFALALYSYPLRMSIVRWIVYGLFFFGLTQTLTTRRRIETAIACILSVACFDALYGLYETYSGSKHIWWYPLASRDRSVNGTYINRNHFAGLMEMALLLAAAYTAALSHRVQTAAGSHRDRPFRVRLAARLSGERRLSMQGLTIASAVIIGTALFLSASRGGIIAAAGGMLVMGLFFLLRRSHRRKGYVALAVFLLALCYSLFTGMEYTLERFESIDTAYTARERYTQKTLEMFRDHKLAGVGLGSFQYAFPRYQTREDNQFIDYAHNDWAQLLAEAGTAGLLILASGLLFFLVRTFRIWRERHDPFAVCIGIVPFAAFTAMGIHSLSDFNLHIPANVLTLLAVTAVGYAALHSRRVRDMDKNLYSFRRIPFKYTGALLLSAVLLSTLWAGQWTVRHFAAETLCATVPNSTLNVERYPSPERIASAITWDAWNAEYRYALAESLIKARDASPRDRTALTLEIIATLEEAVRLNPFAAPYHQRLGWEYSYMWQDPDYHRKWLPAADASMERASWFTNEKNSWLHEDLGNYWTMRSKTIDPANPAWQSAWARARWHYDKALSLKSGRARQATLDRIKGYIWIFYPDEKFLSIG